MLSQMLVLLLISFVTSQNSGNYLDVKLHQGPVRGFKYPETELYAFYGIPYATEPKGKDKFKPPLPAPTWNNIFKATEQNIYCAQPQRMNTSLVFSDNCLLTNVFIPVNNARNLSVLVHVHGGRFQFSNGLERQFKRLSAEGNIITVLFNYRLGANGFLCLGTENAPGNAEIKDQIALLRWVQNNIANFGGNPDDVTIAGDSAGSVSVDILLVSQLTQGLFHKAIHESGIALSWGVQHNPINNALEFAALFEFHPKNMIELEDFYVTLSIDDLVKAANLNFPNAKYLFVPCVERDNDGTAVINEAPLDIIRSQNFNKVPILSGVCNQEGLVFYNEFGIFKTNFENNIINFLPPDLSVKDGNIYVKKTLTDVYLVNSSATILSFVEEIGDQLFYYPTLRVTKARIKAGFDVYLYLYTYFDSSSQSTFPDVPGATHTAQTNALSEIPAMNITFDESYLTEEFKKVRKQMRALWISFVKNGCPVIGATEQYPQGWPPSTAAGLPYMSLGSDSKLLYGGYLPKRSTIWDELYNKYYKQPIPPRKTIRRKVQIKKMIESSNNV